MADIVELERRITAALDEIAKSIAERPATGQTEAIGADADLQEELEIERATNARLVSSREKHVARIERLETRVIRLSERLEALGTENKRLLDVIEALRSNNAALRAANADYQDASGAVNTALAAELDHLKAANTAQRNELEEILAELGPMMKEA